MCPGLSPLSHEAVAASACQDRPGGRALRVPLDDSDRSCALCRAKAQIHESMATLAW
jgi:hypothetical protein